VGEIGAGLIVAIATKYNDFHVNFAQFGYFRSFRAKFQQLLVSRRTIKDQK
jgi:hypothetical protein